MGLLNSFHLNAPLMEFGIAPFQKCWGKMGHSVLDLLRLTVEKGLREGFFHLSHLKIHSDDFGSSPFWNTDEV